jgi:rubredoxin
MGFVARMAAYWQCDLCGSEWFLDSESGPRQCPECGSRKWNDSMMKDSDLYQQALVERHLNPQRKPLTRTTANRRIRRIEVAQKAAQHSRRCPDALAELHLNTPPKGKVGRLLALLAQLNG